MNPLYADSAETRLASNKCWKCKKQRPDRKVKLSTKEQEVKDTMLVGTRFGVLAPPDFVGMVFTVDAIAADGTYTIDVQDLDDKHQKSPGMTISQILKTGYEILKPLTKEEREEKLSALQCALRRCVLWWLQLWLPR